MSYNLVSFTASFLLEAASPAKKSTSSQFQADILLLLAGTKLELQQFSFFRFSAWEYILAFFTFFSLIMLFFLKKLSRIGDFPPKFAYPTPSYKMPKKAPIPHQILHCGTGDSLIKYYKKNNKIFKSKRLKVQVNKIARKY